MTGSLATVTEVLNSLSEQGWTTDFLVTGDRVRCGGCGQVGGASQMALDAVYRFEGPSDPGDEMIVVAVTCLSCGRRGALAFGYGPSTPDEGAAVLLGLQPR